MIDNNGVWIPDMSGVEQYVEQYSKPLLPEKIEEETDWEARHRKREEEREQTRKRIRNSAGSNEYFHKGMPIPSVTDKDNKLVAVYARVSTTDQTSSIENQAVYYTKKIGENENWEMQEIYSDEGKSGMEVKHRTEFQRMIADAAKGKMDMIICASVSRFARDISDCIKYITKLRTMNPRHPVGVYFETENLYTLDPNSEQVLHFHAMLAHWESANKSRRMILSYDQRICTGQYPVSDLLGYRHTKDGDLVIHEEEAKTVRYIFLALVAGQSCDDIAETLTEKKRSTLKGNKEWNGGMVRGLLDNERRWGDLEARKTIVLDPREKIVVKNNGIRDWAFVPEHHEGIVTPDIAKAAQFMASSHGRLDGVPDLRVIEDGALKGFVSICPRWNGINLDAILSASRNVYTDEELSDLEREVRIWTGEEHSNVLSMELTGYEVPPGIMYLTRSMPSMTITKKSVRFNKPCFTRFGGCEWVEMLYHPVMQTVVIRKSGPENVNSFRWVTESGNMCSSIETRAFSSAIYEGLSWIRDYQFRFRGITKVRGNSKIMIFYLDEPQILVGKTNVDMIGKTTSQYIPYRTDSKPEKTEGGFLAFPQEWNHHYKVNNQVRKRREKTFSAITENDILNPGVGAVNPLIGAIPGREEVLRELEELLLSM